MRVKYPAGEGNVSVHGLHRYERYACLIGLTIAPRSQTKMDCPSWLKSNSLSQLYLWVSTYYSVYSTVPPQIIG